MATRRPLSATGCLKACVKDQPYHLPDGHGLRLKVYPTGRKVWQWRYEMPSAVPEEGRAKPREGIYTLGEYLHSSPIGETPEEADRRINEGQQLTLSEARKAVDRARALVRQGIHPTEHRKALQRAKSAAQARTFSAVAAEWLKAKQTTLRQNTIRSYQHRLTLFVLPAFGDTPIAHMDSDAIRDVLLRLLDTAGSRNTKDAQMVTRMVCEYAMEVGYLKHNPVQRWRNLIPPHAVTHHRALGKDEVGQLLRDVSTAKWLPETYAAFRLMWWTLCRPSEAIGAMWAEFNLDDGVWRIPAGRMKAKREHVVYLPRQAIDMLKELRSVSPVNATHCFPHRRTPGKAMSSTVFGTVMKATGWKGRGYSPHATRTTGSTILNGMGYDRDWIEQQLAHLDKDAIRRTYNHATYEEGRKRMMQEWADMLDSWEHGAKVIPFQKKA